MSIELNPATYAQRLHDFEHRPDAEFWAEMPPHWLPIIRSWNSDQAQQFWQAVDLILENSDAD